MSQSYSSSNNSIQLLQRLSHVSRLQDSYLFELTDDSESSGKERHSYKNNSYLLGELLVEFGLITDDLLEQALSEAKEYGIPLGRVLVMSGWLTQKQINWSIQLQSLLRDESISHAIALQAADLITGSNMSLEAALETTGCEKALTSRNTRLGDLLVDAEIISSEDLEEATFRSQYLGLPLGRTLFLAGLVSSTILDTAVNAQRFVREGKLERTDAVHAIRRSFIRQELDPDSMRTGSHIYSSTQRIKLGELLSLAGILSESQIDYAVELGLVNNLPVGKVLADLGLITDKTLEEALLLQVMVAEGSLSPQEAAYALIDMHYHGHSVPTAIAQCGSPDRKRKTLDFKDFLAGTGVMNRAALDEKLEEALNSPYIVARALTFTGAVSEATMQTAMCVHFYIKEGLLSFDEAMVLFDHATRHNLSVDDSLQQLGFGLKLTCMSNKDNPCAENHRSHFDLLKIEHPEYAGGQALYREAV